MAAAKVKIEVSALCKATLGEKGVEEMAQSAIENWREQMLTDPIAVEDGFEDPSPMEYGTSFSEQHAPTGKMVGVSIREEGGSTIVSVFLVEELDLPPGVEWA